MASHESDKDARSPANAIQQASKIFTNHVDKKISLGYAGSMDGTLTSGEYLDQTRHGYFLSQHRDAGNIIDQVQTQIEEAHGRFAAKMDNDPSGGYSSDEEHHKDHIPELPRNLTFLIAVETHLEILKVAMAGGWARAYPGLSI